MSAMDEIEALRASFLTTGVLATLDAAIALTFTTLSAAPPAAELDLVHVLCSLLDLCYSTTNQATDLLNATQVLEDAIAATPSEDARRARMLHDLSIYHGDSFTRTADVQAIAKAVVAAEAAVAATPAADPTRAAVCASLATHLAHTCDAPGAQGLVALDRAVWATRAALAATPRADARRALLLNNVGGFLSARFARLGELADLDGAIEAGEAAVAAVAEEHPHRATVLANLSTYRSNRFDRAGDIADLVAAIDLRQRALDIAPLDDPGRAGGLQRLAYRLHCRYERAGAGEDLENAVRASEAAVAATPPEHADRAARLGGLACYLAARFALHDDMADLDRAVAASAAAASATPHGHAQRAAVLTNLGSILSTRFQRVGAIEDLTAAIAAGDAAVAETPPSHVLRARVLNTSSGFYAMRFDRLADVEDLQKAVAASRAAVECTPPGDPLRACMLNALSSRLSKRFAALDDPHDLAEALELLHSALGLPPSSDIHLLANTLDNLSIAHRRRYTRLGAPHDLDAAIAASHRAVAATRPSHPDRASILNNLGTALHARFEARGDPRDLRGAIRSSEAAVGAVVAATGPDRAVRMSNLSCSLARRFECVGELADIDRAVAMSGDALDALLDDQDPRRADLLGQLASQLHLRFTRLSTLEDVEGAISAGREALERTAQGDPERAGRGNNLACYLAKRYERLGEMADLHAAIELTEDAVAAIPADHPDRVSMVSNLGNRWLRRFQARGGGGDAVGDLEKAVGAAAEGVAATPLGHMDRAGRLNNLGNAYLSRFEAVGEPADLERAVRACEAAIDATPDGHPDRGHMLLLLATALHLRPGAGGAGGPTTDFDRSLAAALEAWNSTMSPPRFRISAARLAGALLSSANRWPEASSVLCAAVALLPNVSPQFLRRTDQEHLLGQFTDLASTAASTALHTGAPPAHCLAVLELGRGIIMGFTIACRSDVSELRAADRTAWERFTRLRAEIDSPLPSADESSRGRRVRAVREFDDTLRAIRTLPRMQRFQMPPSEQDLVGIAAGGSTVVVVNSTGLRSDALIVRSTAIMALPLPTMLHADVARRMSRLPQLVRGKRSTYAARNRELRDTLLWLWEVAVAPICEHVGLVAADGVRLPRLTWIGVGALGNAPFHAAGEHADASTRNTLSRAVSSYVATIKALSYAREKDLTLDADSRVLVVTMATTPDTPATSTSPAVRWSPLAGAALEADEIAAAVAHTTRLDSPTPATVRGVLGEYAVIHFACHGVSDSVRPSESYLLLRASDEADPASARLTVRDVSALTMRTAQIAYLSACSTADNAALPLADEAIHVAGGFQLAGFAHVLATLWPASDECCRRVAGVFYRRLADAACAGGAHGSVAEAFHGAVGVLRAENREQPVKWAAFVHMGA